MVHKEPNEDEQSRRDGGCEENESPGRRLGGQSSHDGPQGSSQNKSHVQDPQGGPSFIIAEAVANHGDAHLHRVSEQENIE